MSTPQYEDVEDFIDTFLEEGDPEFQRSLRKGARELESGHYLTHRDLKLALANNKLRFGQRSWSLRLRLRWVLRASGFQASTSRGLLLPFLRGWMVKGMAFEALPGRPELATLT
jgi:hypothetical protein